MTSKNSRALVLALASLLTVLPTPAWATDAALSQKLHVSESPAKARPHGHAAASAEGPKLVVAIVIDQFRADALLRWRDRFSKGGFRRLIDNGAVFPFAQYPVLQNMTCPGHTMILTGSVPAQNHIPLNEWYDPKAKKLVYCVDDDKDGVSPRRAEGDMLGDEMKLRWPESKVVGISFKDRAAVMLAGHAADAAYWFDEKVLSFQSSTYYKNRSNEIVGWTPPMAPKKDEEVSWKNSLGSRPFEKHAKWGTSEGFATPLSLDVTLAAAKRVLAVHHLGQGLSPDLLAVSLSTHDFVGHRYGPDSAEVEDLTLQEDRILKELFEELDHKIPGGMKNVWVLLTADHGASPIAEHAIELGLDAGRISQKENIKSLNTALESKFGACKDGWISGFKSFNFYYSPECVAQLGRRKPEFEAYARAEILAWPGASTVYSRTDFDQGHYALNFESQIKKSYVPGISGDLILIPRPFWYEKDGAPSTHMTSYTYDRTVPLVLMGSPFRKGVYNTPAQVIDAAPTLAYALRVLAPSLSEGRVLSEALNPEKL